VPFGGVPPGTVPEGGDRDRGDDDDDEIEGLPTGQRFVNPVASGRQFLFGGGSTTENVANLLPTEQDLSGQPTGEVEPITEIGQAALDTEESVFGFEFDDDNTLF